MKTVIEILKLSTSYLQTKNIEKARRFSEELLSHVLKLPRLDLYMQHDRPVEEKELFILRNLLARAVKGEPVEYILGQMSFYGCLLHVDRRALIPRPETELLVDLIVKTSPKGALWDLCCGTGAIGIALKKKIPSLDVSLSDISPEAIELAMENVRQNFVEASLFQGDFLHPFEGKKADLIVCNPPYVSSQEYLSLDPSVRNFEPSLALLGGTSFYQRLANEVDPFLKPGGQLWLEIGATQALEVKKIFSQGPWQQQRLFSDWAGKDRFFFLEKQVLSGVSCLE